MPEELYDIKVYIFIIVVGTASFTFAITCLMARVRIKRLHEICNSLRKANDNLSRTFPDIKVLLEACNNKNEQTPAEPAGLQLYKAIRAKGAPDIMFGDITEVIIAANKRSKAMELLRSIEGFKDDDWWVLKDVQEERVINVKYLGEL